MIAGADPVAVETFGASAPLVTALDPPRVEKAAGRAGWMRDISLLARPRIAVMVLATVFVAAWLTRSKDLLLECHRSGKPYETVTERWFEAHFEEENHGRD